MKRMQDLADNPWRSRGRPYIGPLYSCQLPRYTQPTLRIRGHAYQGVRGGGLIEARTE